MVKLYSWYFSVNEPVVRFVNLRNSRAEQEYREFEDLNRARITASSYIDCCRWIVESFQESELSESNESEDLTEELAQENFAELIIPDLFYTKLKYKVQTFDLVFKPLGDALKRDTDNKLIACGITPIRIEPVN
eukprot:NODE_542_length_6882_cov_0.127967.p5 type:complete len:134 gc:universal NODE_542_length_6882_cov_0.127967:4286-3885(-)